MQVNGAVDGPDLDDGAAHVAGAGVVCRAWVFTFRRGHEGASPDVDRDGVLPRAARVNPDKKGCTGSSECSCT
ncbi:hypothetical protein GCM10009603_42890 [Nocardiopsis exhalans]